MQNQKIFEIIHPGVIIKDTIFNEYYYVLSLTNKKCQYIKAVNSAGNSLIINDIDSSRMEDFVVVSTIFSLSALPPPDEA